MIVLTGRKDHALERVQACRTVGLPGGDPGEVSRLVREISQQVVAQFVIAATGEETLELRHPGVAAELADLHRECLGRVDARKSEPGDEKKNDSEHGRLPMQRMFGGCG